MRIMGNLDTASLENMACASKRFNDIVRSPLVWKALFFRDFPQLGRSIGPPKRFFTPLTANADWKSEYIERSALLRTLARGKLRDLNRMKSMSLRPSTSTTLDYDAWRGGPRGTITHIAANFPERLPDGERKGYPRLIAASTDSNLVSYSDYTCGSVERSPFAHGRLGVLDAGPIPIEHPLETSVFDVCEPVGWIHGKPYDGGLVCIFSQLSTRPPQWTCGLWTSPAFTYEGPDGPITTSNPGTITSVWIAKSRKPGGIFKTSGYHFGALSGSSRGILTAYEIRSPNGNVITDTREGLAAWKICPGIPIVDIKVKDTYNIKDWKAQKPWCFVTNMFGEVYYSTTLPNSEDKRAEIEWHMIPQTARVPNPNLDDGLRKRFTENEYYPFEAPWKSYSHFWEHWSSSWWVEVDWAELRVLRGKDGKATHIDRYTADPTNLDQRPLDWEVSSLAFRDALDVDVTSHSIDNSNQFTAIEGQAEPDGISIGNNARLFTVGSGEGIAYIWNMRSTDSTVAPVRRIQTSSPAICSIAITPLYLVHGGIDGSCKAWDIFGDVSVPLRTLNANPPSYVHHFLANLRARQLIDPNYQDTTWWIRAITLDPDPTSLRGVFGLGTNVRSFSIAAPALNRRKKIRKPRPAAAPAGSTPKRAGNAYKKVIVSETRDVLAKKEKEERENEWLESRFGNSWSLRGRDDLTEEEQLQLAQAMSMSVEEINAQKASSDYASTDSSGKDEAPHSPTDSSATSPEETATGMEEPTTDDELARAIAASLQETSPHSPSEETATGWDWETPIKDNELARAIEASLQEPSHPSLSDLPPLASMPFNSFDTHDFGASSSASAAPFRIIDKQRGKKKKPMHSYVTANDIPFEDELQEAIRRSLTEVPVPVFSSRERARDNEKAWGGSGKGKGRAY